MERTHPSLLNKGRIENLSDSIFAFAMTLLVLNLEVPQPSAALRLSMQSVLESLNTDFMQYAVAFLALAVFWTIHHRQFNYITHIDMKMLWLNIISLMLVALVPFSTQLADTYYNDRFALIIFEGNFLLLGLIFYLQWIYATTGCRLVDKDLNPKIAFYESRMNMVVPAISCAAILLSTFDLYWSAYLYILSPAAFIIFPRARINGKITELHLQKKL
jgi:uncharacterized membrane protein